MRCLLALSCLVAAAVGCSGSSDGIEFASVKGKVVINGEPAPGIEVTFEPVQLGDEVIVGPSSAAITDAEGRFILQTKSGKARPAAVVGEHNVTLRVFQEFTSDEDTGVETMSQTSRYKLKRDQESGYKFTVPKGGTDEAVFSVDQVEVDSP